MIGNKGFGMLGVSIAAVAVGAAIFGGISWVQSVQKNQNHAFMRTSADLIMSQVISTIENDKAWINTVRNNPVLSCYNGGVSKDCAGAAGAISIFRSDNQLLQDAVTPSMGFNFDGSSCNTYNAVTGSDDCPFRATIQAKACPDGGNCFSSGQMDSTSLVAAYPPVQLTVSLKFKPQTANFGRLNEQTTGNYNLIYIRGERSAGVERNCQFMGGTYNSTTGFCSVGLSTTSTPTPGTFVKQIDGSGAPYFYRFYPTVGTVCGIRSGVVGIDPDGQFVCGKF